MLLTALGSALLAGPASAQQEAAPVPGAAPAEAASAPADGTLLRIEVSVSERQLYVYRGDEVLSTYPVAVGKAEHPTPTGQFRIGTVIWNPRWVPPKAGWARGKTPKGPGDPDNPMGKVKMFFQPPDYYIHGTNNEESLGHAASHGCVRMANSDVVELARVVMENGGEPREPNWFQRILNRVRSSETVKLSKPVAITITG